MALTDDFSYKLGESGVVLNPDSLTPPFVDITKVQGLDSTEYRTTERDHEGTDGGFIDAVYAKGRTIVLEGMAYAAGEEVESFLDSLKANFAPSRTLVPFYFKHPGVTERFLRVKPLPVRYDVDTLRRVGCTDIQFQMFAEDPRIYSAELRSESIPETPITLPGRDYNRSYNYGYGGSPVTPYTVNLPNNGNWATPVIFTIAGPATNPRIINDTLGITLTFMLEVPSGSVLEIDTYYHTVRLDGANRRGSLVVPNWFNLQPGDNIIRYSSNFASGSVLTARYYDAWR